MGNPEGAVLGALSNGVVFGGLVSATVASWACDKYGRKPAVIFGQAISVLGSILQGVSTNYTFFLMSRIIIGFGTGFTNVASPSMIAELAHPKYRVTSQTMYNPLWYLGAMIAAWTTYGTHDIQSNYSWRIPSYIQGALPLLQIVFFLIDMPESPRYLISKGKIEEATKILKRIHTGNDESEQAKKFIDFEVREIQVALEMEKLSNNAKYTDFFKLPTYRKRIFLVAFTAFFMQLSGNGLVSYYFNKVLETIGYTEPQEQLKINGGLMVYNLGICWVLVLFVPRFKRRTMFLSSAIWMLVCYVIWTILSARFAIEGYENRSLANAVLSFIFLYYLGYNAGCNLLPFLYVVEVLPYSHRAKGLNVFGALLNTTLIFNGFVNPIAMDAIQWKYYIVYCCVLAVEAVVIYLFYVETSGYSLEEVAIAFGDDPKNIMPKVNKEEIV
ncbi:hypothetical protein G210_5226, partial [Candida maltosa Xu316]